MNTATINNCTVPELLRLAEGTDDPLARRLADELETQLGETGEWEAEQERLLDQIEDLERQVESAEDDAEQARADATEAEAACVTLEAENEELRARVLELENRS
ncbi:MAG: hypothetical protein K0U78_13615 [Actinomycetia bacterium]|nr:hypothetical protein [Actinomycetes bacterium]